MRVAVVTPYYKESTELLNRCHDSVLAQTEGDVTHFMLSDGFPNPVVDTWEKTIHVKLPNHGDYGDTPRGIGGLMAASMGFDAITLLDADNWFEPNHIELLAKAQRETGAMVVTGTRNLMRTDGSFMAVCKESDGDLFNDTNCYLIMRDAFPSLSSWGFKYKAEAITGDRVFWKRILDSGFSRVHCHEPTVNYVTTIASHYLQNAETPPSGSKVIVKFSGEKYHRMILYEVYLKALEARNR